MPIKEIIQFAVGIFALLWVTHGSGHFKEAVRTFEINILKEVRRTDNWGNPSIFRSSHRK